MSRRSLAERRAEFFSNHPNYGGNGSTLNYQDQFVQETLAHSEYQTRILSEIADSVKTQESLAWGAMLNRIINGTRVYER